MATLAQRSKNTQITLDYIKNDKRLNPWKDWWTLFFTRFQFTVTYHSWDKEQQRWCPFTSPQPSLSTHVPWLHPATIHNLCLIKEIRQVQHLKPPPPPTKHYVPDDLLCVFGLFTGPHTAYSSANSGIHRITALTKRLLVAPPAHNVDTYVKACQACSQSKFSHQHPVGLLESLPVPQRLWSYLSVDLITDLPSSSNYTTILMAIDRFSKSCHLISLKGRPTAMETTKVLFHHVFKIYVLPEDILSDQGKVHLTSLEDILLSTGY